MINIGVYNKLIAFRREEQGIYLLDKVDREEVLLPNKLIPEGLEIGDVIEVFVYKDSEDREVATTETPKIILNQIRTLEVVDVNNVGAFLDWGLIKDLLLPFREQSKDLVKGEKVAVFLTLDYKSERLIASTKLDRFISNEDVDLNPGQEVDIIVYRESDLGYNVVVNGKFKGLLYKNEVFKTLPVGFESKAYVKKVRDDGKIDLILQKHGFKAMDDHTQIIMDYLESKGGKSELNDKSDPELIKSELQMSKKAFKKAIGVLYRKGVLVIEDKGISVKN